MEGRGARLETKVLVLLQHCNTNALPDQISSQLDCVLWSPELTPEKVLTLADAATQEVILDLLSVDYHETLMAAAGHQAEELLEQTIEKYDGQYILACEGNPPLNEDGMYCIVGGRPFVEQLREVCSDAMAVISWGSCASWGSSPFLSSASS